MREFIGLDWGTSSFRAYRIDANGQIIDQRVATAGILSVAAHGFSSALEHHIGDWPVELPVLAAGMIGSAQGWIEAPYAQCPAGADDLATRIVEITSPQGRTICFVPGLLYLSADGTPDVMRGEEVQVIGAGGSGDDIFLAPGTHSKWIRVRDGRILSFTTYMTGESYALYRHHSILSRTITGDDYDEKSFTAGFERAAADPAGLLHLLFATRSLTLFQQLPPEQASSYLSGLLIGAELGHALSGHALSGHALSQSPRPKRITLLGSTHLAQRYSAALKLSGIESVIADPDIIVKGLTRIADIRIGRS